MNVPRGDSKEASRWLPFIGCFQKVRAEGARPLSLMHEIKYKVECVWAIWEPNFQISSSS